MIPNIKHWISFGNCWSFKINNAGDQGSPTPRPRKGTGPRSLRRWATQHEVSCRRVSEASCMFTDASTARITAWAQAKSRAPPDSALWWAAELHHCTSRCNNNRNKVHKKCTVLESSWNHPPSSLVGGKTVFHELSTWCWWGWGPLL